MAAEDEGPLRRFTDLEGLIHFVLPSLSSALGFRGSDGVESVVDDRASEWIGSTSAEA